MRKFKRSKNFELMCSGDKPHIYLTNVGSLPEGYCRTVAQDKDRVYVSREGYHGLLKALANLKALEDKQKSVIH